MQCGLDLLADRDTEDRFPRYLKDVQMNLVVSMLLKFDPIVSLYQQSKNNGLPIFFIQHALRCT